MFDDDGRRIVIPHCRSWNQSMNEADLQYPLLQHAADHLRAGSGRPLNAITREADLSLADLQISAETLRAQAAVARAAGYAPLAENLIRAAELTAVPNDEVLRMYNLLRPGHANHAELLALAKTLETRYAASACARLVREAAEVYRARGLVKTG
jgi:propanediol dehydratase small subunit